MFALRIIEETRDSVMDPFDSVPENFALGNSYAVLRKGATKEFEEEMKRSYPEMTDKEVENIRALLCAENGVKFFILKETSLMNYNYFIMTENGKTFERL